MKALIAVAAISILLLGCAGTQGPQSTVQPQQCGGLAGLNCPNGFSCDYSANPPGSADMFGKCVEAKPTPTIQASPSPAAYEASQDQGLDDAIKELEELNGSA